MKEPKETSNFQSKDIRELQATIDKLTLEINALKDANENSEIRYDRLVTNSAAGYFFIDKDGIIQDVNDTWVALYKYDSKDEIIGHHFTKIQRLDDIELAKTFFSEIMNNNPDYSKGEFSRKCKDGSIGYHSFSANPVYKFNEIVGIEGFIFDTTDRRIAENELRDKSSFLDKIIESSPISTWISDAKGTAIRINPACAKFFGATEEEVVGKYNLFKDKVIEEQGFLPEIKKVFENGEVADIIIDYDFASVDHIEVKDATHKLVNSKFTPVFDDQWNVTNVIVQAIDLTEVKKAEQAAIDERNIAQQYLDIANVILVSIDSEGLVQMINPKGCKVLGYDKDEILGKNWFDSFLPERLKTSVKEVAKQVILGNIEAVEYYENVVLTKSGEERLIAWNNAVLKDKNNRIIGTLSSGEDITEKQVSEEALRASEAKFKALVTNSEGIVYIIAKDGTFQLSEGKGLSSLGLQPGEVVGQSVFELYKAYPKMLDEMRRVFQGETINSEVLIADSIYFKNWYTPQRSKDGEIIGLLGLSIDITEQKKNEKELKKHRVDLEQLVRERTLELEKKNQELDQAIKVFVGRELTIAKLEKKIKELEQDR